MTFKRNRRRNNIILIALLVILVIVIYLFTIGNVDFTDKIDDSEGQPIDERKRRHDRLKNHLEKQKALKEKLAKRFKRIFFVIRTLLILIWATIVFIFYKLDWINDLEDFLNYSQALFILIVVTNFWTFGNLANLKSFLSTLKNSIESRVWGKYVSLPEKIIDNENELKRISTKETPTSE